MTTAAAETKTSRPTILQRLSLYDIALEGKLIEDILIQGDGELTPETEARMDALLASGKPKIEGAILIIKELEASEGVASLEARRMAQRKQAFERNAESLKNRVAVALDSAFNGKVKTDRVTTWTQKAVDKLEIEFQAVDSTLENLFAARPDLVKEEKVYSLNTDAIRAIWEEEAPEREAYAAELADYKAVMAARESGQACEWAGEIQEPAEPQSKIPAVIRVELIEGRRFLQIR